MISHGEKLIFIIFRHFTHLQQAKLYMHFSCDWNVFLSIIQQFTPHFCILFFQMLLFNSVSTELIRHDIWHFQFFAFLQERTDVKSEYQSYGDKTKETAQWLFENRSYGSNIQIFFIHPETNNCTCGHWVIKI